MSSRPATMRNRRERRKRMDRHLVGVGCGEEPRVVRTKVLRCPYARLYRNDARPADGEFDTRNTLRSCPENEPFRNKGSDTYLDMRNQGVRHLSQARHQREDAPDITNHPSSIRNDALTGRSGRALCCASARHLRHHLTFPACQLWTCWRFFPTRTTPS